MHRLFVISVIFSLLLVACGSGDAEETAVSPMAVTQSPTPQIGVDFATRAVPTTAVLSNNAYTFAYADRHPNGHSHRLPN